MTRFLFFLTVVIALAVTPVTTRGGAGTRSVPPGGQGVGRMDTAAPLVRVFVETDDNGEAGELAARQQSVKDLDSALAAKKKSLAVVDASDKADVILTVEDRAVTVPKVVFGMGARPGQPPGRGGVVRVAVLHVALVWNNQTIRFSNKNKPAEDARGWKSAADDIATQIEKWISAHRAEMLQGR